MFIRDAFGLFDLVPVSSPPKGVTSANFIDFLPRASSVLTISHVGVLDGPIMSYLTPVREHTADEGDDWRRRQPWHTNGTGRKLCLIGFLFWHNVGSAPRTSKIIILGCESGNFYSQCVANAAGIPAWGFDHSCAAADIATMRPIVTAIESGKEHKAVKKSRPGGG